MVLKKTENAFLGNLSNMAAGYDTPPSRAFLTLFGARAAADILAVKTEDRVDKMEF